MDQRIGLLAVDLAADTSQIDVDDVGCGIEMEVPDVLQQHGAGNNLALIANQVLKNLEFTRQEFDFAAGAARCPGDEIKFQIADAQHRLLDDRVAAASK